MHELISASPLGYQLARKSDSELHHSLDDLRHCYRIVAVDENGTVLKKSIGDDGESFGSFLE
jgi:hypothetical protein